MAAARPGHQHALDCGSVASPCAAPQGWRHPRGQRCLPTDPV